MHEHEWRPTKITIRQNCKLEDGLPKDNYPILMPWIPLREEPEEGLQDQKKSITTYPCTHHEEDSYKGEGEEVTPAKT